MKIGVRGQITIPKNLREKYGLLPNMEVDIKPGTSGLLIQKKSLHISPVQAVYGILNNKSKTDNYIEEVRGR